MENDLRNLLLKHGFSFKKKYGQNFLTDENLLKEIAEKAEIDKNTVVLEIGCGAGALTSVLCDCAKKVVGYEIDISLKPVLGEVLKGKDNVEIVYKDVLKENLKELENKLGENYVLVANLPYYITTPIIMTFIEKAEKIKSLVVMVQEEVADRLSAAAGEKDYGAITVAINLRGSAKTILSVPRTKFTPAPNVDSAVVKIDIDTSKNAGMDFAAVRETVKCAFLSRRKMLVNNLMNYYKISRTQAENLLNECGIPLTARGETLDESAFIALSESIKRL